MSAPEANAPGIELFLLSNIGDPNGNARTLPVGALETNPSSAIVQALAACMSDVAVQNTDTDIRYSLKNFYVYVAIDARGSYKGYLAWRFEKGRSGEPENMIRIKRLHVHPNARSLKIGKRLLETVFTYSKLRNLDIKILTMSAIERPAYPYFEKFGCYRFRYNNEKAHRSDVIEVWFKPNATHIEWTKQASGYWLPQRRKRGEGPARRTSVASTSSSLSSSSSAPSSRRASLNVPHGESSRSQPIPAAPVSQQRPQAATPPAPSVRRRRTHHRSGGKKKDEGCVVQ